MKISSHKKVRCKNELKEKRQEKNFTQEELAGLANIAMRSYCYYESGERIPDVCTAQRLAKVLETTVEVLFPLPHRNGTCEINQYQNNNTK